METADELQAFLAANTPEGIRGRLLAIGEARAIVRRDGDLPDDAPAFREELDADLNDYGFSLLRASLAYREAEGNPEIWHLGFRRAGDTFDALTRNGSPDVPNRGFLRVMGAAAYHLAGYSAMAYSLLAAATSDQNLAPAESAIASLILRDLSGLRTQARAWLLDSDHEDASIAEDLSDGNVDGDEAIATILSSTIFRAFAFFDFALATGDARLRQTASELLQNAVTLAKDANAVSLWWIARVSLNLIGDLWDSSLHNTLPRNGPQMPLNILRITEAHGTPRPRRQRSRPSI